VRHVLARRRADGAELISRELAREIDVALAAGGQVVLLHNRRGYSIYLRCVRCGQVAACERCQATLVYHEPQRELRCHRCGLRRPLLEHCPDDTCGGELRAGGGAIQKLEEELRTRFPAARLQRLDSDTMRRREDYAAALERFASGTADILLGTQMVAKGLDFPNVRLVGVIDADAALLLPDFRAGERVFQMLVQVVGRAGRREGESLAIVQTAAEPAGVIRAALQMDYEAMAAGELEYRRRLVLPPFVRLARVLFLDDRTGRARAAADAAARALREAAARIRADLRVDEASPCVIPRLRELRRYQVLVRSPSSTALHELLQRAASEGVFRGSKRVVVDVDPVDVL
jgi:primosomal protein N' (replication factor Y)